MAKKSEQTTERTTERTALDAYREITEAVKQLIDAQKKLSYILKSNIKDMKELNELKDSQQE